MPRPGSYSTRAPAWERREYAGWRPPETTRRSQSTERPSSSTALSSPCFPCAAIWRTRLSRRSTTSAISVPARSELVDDRQRPVVGADHDGALARLERPEVHEPPDAAGQHDPDEVVAREDERLLERSRGDDDPLGAEAVEDPAGVDRDEAALEDPDRAGRSEDLEAARRRGGARGRGPRRRARRPRRGRRPRGPRPGRRGRRRSRASRRGDARRRSGAPGLRACRPCRARRRCGGTSRRAATPCRGWIIVR